MDRKVSKAVFCRVGREINISSHLKLVQALYSCQRHTQKVEYQLDCLALHIFHLWFKVYC